MFIYGFVLNSIPPVLPLIVAEFSITLAEAGLLMTFFAVPALVSIPSVLIIIKFGVKKISILGLGFLLIGALITVFSTNFATLLIGRLVGGVGGTLVFVTAASIIPMWFDQKEQGKAMGIFALTVPISVLLVLAIGARISEIFGGWRNWLLLGVVVIVVILFLNLFLLKERRSLKKNNISIKFHKEVLYDRNIWLVALAWLCFNITSISLVTYGPTFLLSEKSLSLSLAGVIMSLYMASALPVGPTIGWLIQRYGRRIFIILGNIGFAFFLLVFPLTELIYIPIILIVLGIFAAMTPPPIFAYPKELTEEKSVSFAFGIISTCTAIAVLVVPIVGYLKDITGAYNASFWAMSFSAFIAALFIFFLKVK
jgi:DHA1 family purine base/nucleoside efflux pump-like MFS transporter